jgi:hypothetical protein
VTAWRAGLVVIALAGIPLLAPSPAAAAPLLYLAREEILCDASQAMCIRGTLSYEKNERLLRLRGRLLAATEPGLVRFTLTGTTRQGFRRYAPLEFRIRGRATEIIDRKMIPDEPDVHDWRIDRILFEAASRDLNP